MATAIRCATLRAPPPSLSIVLSKSLKISSFCVSFSRRSTRTNYLHSLPFSDGVSHMGSVERLVTLASSGEAIGTAEVQEFAVQDNADGSIDGKAKDTSPLEEAKAEVDQSVLSPIVSSLWLYKEAVQNNDESKIAEVEAFLKSIEDEKNDLEKRVALLSEEILMEKERILRISADFDNFRKRTEREQLSLVTNAQAEVVEKLLPVLDNFVRAKAQIKVETEGEEKINNSYQSIYKQFEEILASIGVVPIETVEKPFDPLLHEAIMREESTELDEGIIIEEFQKGFKLGDRLLRPSMVKVSAGPGPAKPRSLEPSAGREKACESSEDISGEADVVDDVTL
ncbi:hypothetical protein Nepgr_031821 [Nepenthes gracilis]|uniref:GrpE protein homolog n=1 Tax=Nepenthes gracilis TaxID=150966 RepID=A0AAD3TJD5_NEPGR|nr:hypothetical protein Nepgr_031821 [Nepenthes gracilis]